MKGIILAGGSGSRLAPITNTISKQLLPVYDKPMIYYPLTTLMLAGIDDILIISSPEQLPAFERLLGAGEHWGIKLSYAAQQNPGGIAESFIVGEEFIANEAVCLILGDNIFYGVGLGKQIQSAIRNNNQGGTVFGYSVTDPQRYGVAVYNKDNLLIDIEEKPQYPKSNYAITGLYVYDNTVVDVAKSLRPSDRGELEITDINKHYIQKGNLDLVTLSRGIAWLDTGTPESLLEASQYVAVIESRQGMKVASPEEVAWRMQYISSEQLLSLAGEIPNSSYGHYLTKLVDSGSVGNIK